MKTLSVTISDVEYGMFGIMSDQLNFTDFVDLVSRQLMRQNLNRSVALAEKYGLSSMTMDEITNEVIKKRKRPSMKRAAERLYADYTTDENLTAFTQLDCEDFYESR